MDLESISMTLIAYSGDARTNFFQALALARKGDLQGSEELLEKAKESSKKAHNAQTQLLIQEAKGIEIEINVLLVHAQDHLMTSMLAGELVEELIYLHSENKKIKEKIS